VDDLEAMARYNKSDIKIGYKYMPCPRFIDNTRECIQEIEFLPRNTFDYCTTEKYVGCPFYLILTGDAKVCANIRKCPAFKNFELSDFEKFILMTDKYCVSENHKNCQRFILKAKGEEVPVSLHPDGHLVEGWSK